MWSVAYKTLLSRRDTSFLTFSLFISFIVGILFQDKLIFINIFLFLIVQFFLTALFIKNFFLSAAFLVFEFNLVVIIWFVTLFIPQKFNVLIFLHREHKIILLIISQSMLLLTILNFIRSLSDRYRFREKINYFININFRKGVLMFSVFSCLAILECHLMIKGAFFPNLFMIIVLSLVTLLLFKSLIIDSINYQNQVSIKNLQLILKEEDYYYKKAREYRHDFRSLLVCLQEYLNIGDISGAQQFLEAVVEDKSKYFDEYHFTQVSNVSNPAIKGLLQDFIVQCNLNHIPTSIEVADAGQNIPIPLIDFSRCLSIVMNNALESSVLASTTPKIILIYKNTPELIQFCIRNTVSEKPDLSRILEKGVSTKQNHEGLGLPFILKTSKKYACFTFSISNSSNEFSIVLSLVIDGT